MLQERDVRHYFCDRCEAQFHEADLATAQKHASSDAEHLSYEKVGYVKRGIPGVVFYPLCFFGRLGDEYIDNIEKDEKWLKKPVYEIFVKDPDGRRKVLQTVKGSSNASRAYGKKEDELYEKEGRVTVKKILGIFPYKVHG